jgi:hypothetical protein
MFLAKNFFQIKILTIIIKIITITCDEAQNDFKNSK